MNSSNEGKQITLIVNPNQKVFLYERQMFMQADGTGTLKLNMDEVFVELPKSVLSFENQLQVMLSEDQQYELFEFLGQSKGITIKAFAAAVGVNREGANELIQLGIRNKILVPGWNSTYKVTNKVIKERMAEKAKNRFLEEKRNIQPETMEEQKARLQKKGLLDTDTTEGEGEEGEGSKAVEPVVSNAKVGKINAESLQKELKALEKRLHENKDWNEHETPHTVVNRINAVKAQLRVLSTGKIATKGISLEKKLPVRKKI